MSYDVMIMSMTMIILILNGLALTILILTSENQLKLCSWKDCGNAWFSCLV